MPRDISRNVAIIYHYWAHYRLPIAQRLSTLRNPRFTLFGDTSSGNDIPLIPHSLCADPCPPFGVRFRRLHNTWLFRSVLWQRGLLSVAFGREFDTIVFLGDAHFLSTWVALALARIRGKRTLLWTHGYTRDPRGLSDLIRRTFYRLAHGICLYGHHAQRLLLQRGFDAKKLWVIYNSLDPDLQSALMRNITPSDLAGLRRKLFAHPDDPVIFFIGRLAASKELDVLLRAAQVLQSTSTPINVLLIGGGACQTSLELQARHLGLESRFHVTGPLYTEPQIAPLALLSTLCVAPGAVGLTAMHALGYGKPCITHDDPFSQKPEYEAIVDGVTGAFFRRGDAGHLATTIRAWLTTGPTIAASTASCLAAVQERYHPDSQARRIVAAIMDRPHAHPTS